MTFYAAIRIKSLQIMDRYHIQNFTRQSWNKLTVMEKNLNFLLLMQNQIRGEIIKNLTFREKIGSVLTK